MRVQTIVALLAVAVAIYKFRLNAVDRNQAADAGASLSSGDLRWPEVDISLLRSDNATARAAVAQEILAAGSTHGFFFLKGHGGEATGELEAALQSSRDFFALPAEVKQALAAKRDRPGFTRGYLGLGTESGSHSFEVKEAFSFGYNWPEDRTPANALTGPNVWPTATQMATAAAFRRTMLQWFDRCTALSLDLSRGIALALGLEEDALLQRCGKSAAEISLARLFHYFPADYGLEKAGVDTANTANKEAERIGSSAHTDWGLLTIILQDGVGGLQVFVNGRWHDVPVRPGQLVVNIGDYTSLITAGRLQSPLHRVTLSNAERFSLVHFAYPDFDATMDGLASSSSSSPSSSSSSPSSSGQEKEGTAAVAEKEKERKELSLLKDQSLEGDGAKVPPASFGAYIADKWRQVQRAGADY